LSFCHLHLHTSSSQLDGVGTSEDYAKEAVRIGQPACAITDHGNVDGILKHQKACKKHGITPILGCELYMCGDMKVKNDERHHLIVLVQSREGLTNLMHMISMANLEGFHRRPRIDPDLLLRHTEGLVFLTACIGSFINMEGGEKLLSLLRNMAPTFLEIMPHAHPLQKKHNLRCLELSQKYNIPLVATNDCHYSRKGMGETQDVLLAMKRNAKWNDKDRWSMRDWPNLHLRSADEMAQAFQVQAVLAEPIWRKAMAQTMEVAGLCNGYTVERMQVELPKVHGYEDRDETDLMWEIISDGWERRLGDFYVLPEKAKEYEDRVNEEFGLICQMNFQRYFLIVHELIGWCKSQGIAVGPGRGSSGGSLVCYLMGITDVDPLKYGLIFARFISPERVDYPDIDMDFESARREEVIQHLRDCYGEHGTVNLSTFMTMKGKGAIRDVSRVFDVPLKEVNPAAEGINDVPDGHDRAGHTIEDSLKDSPPLAHLQRKYPDVVRHAINLEGQTKGYGKHAGGICINAKDLRLGDHCSLRVYNGVISANWDKDDAEYMGLMKLDVLGISNLSFLNEAARLVKELHGQTIEFDQIPLDDREVYNEIAQGNTAGAFQIGSTLNTRYCKDLGVREFNDIVLINALTRPGPLGSGITDQFMRRRHGQEPVTYIHPRMEPYTNKTLGLVIYQEQVMWSMFELAGLSWGECDKVRKVIGKSKGATAFQQFKQRFMDGCAAQGTLTPAEAGDVWDMMASFGSYAFNLSHAVEYSMLGYWCVWMRVHWPMEFLCGCLSHCDEKKSGQYIDEARRLGIRIELPKAGVSLADRWLPKDGALWAPLTAIKGVGPSQAAKILAGKVSDRQVKPKKQANVQPAFRGFFDKEIEPPLPEPKSVSGENSMVRLLRRAGYYREQALTWEELREAAGCYDFNVLTGSERFSRVGNLAGFDEQDIITCRLDSHRVNLITIGRYILPVIDCRACELINECSAPVQPSFGRYRIMIAGEAPGKDENLQGIGFVGSAGNDILWPELWKYGFGPTMFHITNIAKCWPSKTRTPGKRHIAACSKWLDMEFEGLRPVMVLAFGGTGVKALRDDQGRISELNGQTEWADKYQCWISWCLHPASVLHNPGNRSEFERGIENFANRLKAIGGGIWARQTGNRQVQAMTCPYGGDFGLANGNYAQCAECQVWEQCTLEKSKTDWLGLQGL